MVANGKLLFSALSAKTTTLLPFLPYPTHALALRNITVNISPIGYKKVSNQVLM